MALIPPCDMGLRLYANSITRFVRSVSITSDLHTAWSFNSAMRNSQAIRLNYGGFRHDLLWEGGNYLFYSFRRSPGTVTWAIREWYGLRGVNMSLGGRNASLQQKTRKPKKPSTHTHTHIHTGEMASHPVSPTRVPHRISAAPTGKIAAALSNVYEYSPHHLFLTVILSMRSGKPRTKILNWAGGLL